MTEKVSYDDYQKIQAQIAELEAKAKSVREALLADEIKAIKAKIKELGLKPSQLFSPSKLAGDSQDAPVSMGEKIAKAKAENCTRARAAKAAFDAGKPITQANAQGEKIFLDGPARAAEAKRIDEIVASDCVR